MRPPRTAVELASARRAKDAIATEDRVTDATATVDRAVVEIETAAGFAIATPIVRARSRHSWMSSTV